MSVLIIDGPPAIVNTARCHYCSRFYLVGDLVAFAGGCLRCPKCWEKHLAALEVLAGKPPQACGECGVTFDQLAERTLGEHVPMYIHAKDGLYQLLCAPCDRRYVELRKDLYGPTPFGYHERKLN